MLPCHFKPNPWEPLWWSLYHPLICLCCTLFPFPLLYHLSLQGQQRLPLNLLQNDLSVKSDPFSLSRTGLRMPKSCWWGARCPLSALQLTTAARKGLLLSSTVTLECVETDKGGCGGWGVLAFLINQISSLSEQREWSWNRDMRQSRINGSKSKICQIWDGVMKWASIAKLRPQTLLKRLGQKKMKSSNFVPDRNSWHKKKDT